ncbi:MAG: carbohydrate ABC transporter permease [Capsulimonas sp.]|uniref:carbohydrate ABC transporter permease n=1 Tax=Capsulimonas sp. TaxID=2494211 RepID=UPI0032673A3C
MSKSIGSNFARVMIAMLLIVCALITLTPIVWLVAATLKNPDDIFHYTFFPPIRALTLDNFRDLFHLTHFGRFMVNSVFTTGATVLVQLFFSSLAGFALAKYEFKGKSAVTGLMLATLMLPASVTMAPLYDLLYHMHMVDQYAGIIVPGAVSVFGIFLFRQAIVQVPDELLQAARLDGCSEFRIYWDIVMPVSRPMIGAFCLMSFMGAWNSFLWPQIILHHDNLFTVPIGLNQLLGVYSSKYGMLMAGTLVGVLPVAALFMLLQKEFVAGLTSGAVKG